MITLLLRGATVVVLAGLAAMGLSLVSGVSLPGLSSPARPPADERPVRHADPTGISTVDAPAGRPALPSPSLVGRISSAPTSAAVVTPVAATGGSPGPTPTATPSSAPGSNGNRPTPSATSHGHPHVTPPGRTKHP